MKIVLWSFTCLLLLFSCNKSKENTTDTLVRSSELLILADSLELKNSEYIDLIDSVNSLNRKSDIFFRKIHLQEKKINELSDRNKILTKENKILTNKTIKPVLSKKEKAIQNMVFKMHKTWEDLPISKNPKELLKFFNSKFLVSRIKINDDNTANVSRFSHDDFKDYLEQTIIEVKGKSIEFKDVDFLSIEIKDNSYFNVVYKCNMQMYQNDRIHSNNSIVVTITGKNVKGTWGISSYSWVNFIYEK